MCRRLCTKTSRIRTRVYRLNNLRYTKGSREITFPRAEHRAIGSDFGRARPGRVGERPEIESCPWPSAIRVVYTVRLRHTRVASRPRTISSTINCICKRFWGKNEKLPRRAPRVRSSNARSSVHQSRSIPVFGATWYVEHESVRFLRVPSTGTEFDDERFRVGRRNFGRPSPRFFYLTKTTVGLVRSIMYAPPLLYTR